MNFSTNKLPVSKMCICYPILRAMGNRASDKFKWPKIIPTFDAAWCCVLFCVCDFRLFSVVNLLTSCDRLFCFFFCCLKFLHLSAVCFWYKQRPFFSYLPCGLVLQLSSLKMISPNHDPGYCSYQFFTKSRQCHDSRRSHIVWFFSWKLAAKI